MSRKIRQEEDAIRFYTANIACAIGHLHSKGILHRDIKPENILVDKVGYLHLTDYGTSKFVQPNVTNNTFVGTTQYMAPEMILGTKHEFPADWWSLGCIVYEMTTGIQPFYSQNQDQIAMRIIKEKTVKFPSPHILVIFFSIL